MSPNPASKAMYPSLEELLACYKTVPIPRDVQESLRERYDAHGWKYASGMLTSEGRPINTCMTKDSIENAREELIDATFNLLVAVFKEDKWQARSALAFTLDALHTLSL